MSHLGVQRTSKGECSRTHIGLYASEGSSLWPILKSTFISKDDVVVEEADVKGKVERKVERR